MDLGSSSLGSPPEGTHIDFKCRYSENAEISPHFLHAFKSVGANQASYGIEMLIDE
jgi:hypothetical protein